MLRSAFQEEEVLLLVLAPGPVGPLGGKGTPSYSPGTTLSGLVTPLGAQEAVKLGLSATTSRWRVRLPAGTHVAPGDRLRFRGRDWKAAQVDERASYTRVIAEEVRTSVS